MDQIIIKDLEIFANHGVYPEENALGQKFLISAVLDCDLRPAGITDALSRSVDYGKVCQMIDQYTRNTTFQLIERLAEGIAHQILMDFPMVKEVEIEVKKPWAPIRLPLDTVSVKIRRGWHKAYLALGSNMGDKEAYIRYAIDCIEELPDTKLGKVASLLITEPYGGVEQDDFLNTALEVDTLLTPKELLKEVNGIEAGAGRERLIHWGPRTLDIDIIFYDDLVLEDDDLCIPHVEMHKREFVLRPLAEIAPYKRHPVYGKTVCEMLGELE